MSHHLTSEEAYARCPDMLEGQEWLGVAQKYSFLCLIHGVYIQQYWHHSRGQNCRKCGYASLHHLKHGHSVGGHFSPTFYTWTGMQSRCLNSNQSCWRLYGGAIPPVQIDSRWLGKRGFENFLADMGERPAGTSLGRYLDTGNYTKSNCAWQTKAEQAAEAIGKSAMRFAHRREEVPFSTRWKWFTRVTVYHETF